MGRKILFITTDQQRYDSLGCNGGTIARTPVIDGLAANGINYRRAYNQNTVCMPARSTMLTGQYVRTHGVVANGVPLPVVELLLLLELPQALGGLGVRARQPLVGAGLRNPGATTRVDARAPAGAADRQRRTGGRGGRRARR